MDKIINLVDIKKEYKDKILFNNFSYTFKKGIYKISGENASGKTTLLKIIAKLITPSSGKVENTFTKIRGDFGPLEFQSETGINYLNYLKNISAKNIPNNILNLAEKFEMQEKIYENISTYSMGEKKKLLLIATFMEDAEVILLDEPFNFLDSASKEKLNEYIMEETKKEKVIIYTSHSKEDIDDIVPAENKIEIK